MRRFLDYCYIGLLALYILAGCALVPLHGDEPTVIYTSADIDTIRRGDIARLIYQDPPPADDPQAATRQELRLLNGVVNRYWYGVLWSIAGMTTRDLNDQWLWGADLAFNRANGHVPSDQLLFLTRWGSGLLTVLSVAAVFIIAKRMGGRRRAYLASAIYALTPALLLNGRRAMMESGFLLCSALLIYAGQRFAYKPDLRRAAWLGLAAGLTIASKHTGLLMIAAVFGSIGLYHLVRGGIAGAARTVGLFIPAAGIMIVIFIILNPVWWNAREIGNMPGRILTARQMLLEGQARTFGGYADTGERASGLIREMFAAPPQYYEVREGWSVWIADQIAAYERSPLAGLSNPFISMFIGVLFVIGGVRAIRNWENGAVFVVLVTAVLSIIAIFVATPVAWQRYYLPLVAPVALVCAFAIRISPHKGTS